MWFKNKFDEILQFSSNTRQGQYWMHKSYIINTIYTLQLYADFPRHLLLLPICFYSGRFTCCCLRSAARNIYHTVVYYLSPKLLLTVCLLSIFYCTLAQCLVDRSFYFVLFILFYCEMIDPWWSVSHNFLPNILHVELITTVNEAQKKFK